MASDGSSVTMYLYHEGGHFTHDFIIGDVATLAQSPNMVFGGLRDVHDGTVRDDSYPPGNPNPPKSGFDGYLDETQYWNAKLTADEIATVYNGGNPVGNGFEVSLSADLQAKLVSWWRFGDDDTFPTITDKVGSNHLTMSHKNAPDPIDANDIVELPTPPPSYTLMTGYSAWNTCQSSDMTKISCATLAECVDTGRTMCDADSSCVGLQVPNKEESDWTLHFGAGHPAVSQWGVYLQLCNTGTWPQTDSNWNFYRRDGS